MAYFLFLPTQVQPSSFNLSETFLSPVVTFDRPLFGSNCASVISNNFEAAYEATMHLIEHGYKRILCFGGEPELYTIQERLQGYRQAMKKAELPLFIDTILGDDTTAALGILRTHLRSRQQPDAVFTLKNSATIVTFQALQRLKIPIPSRLALLGFDDFELSTTLQPAISVVQQPIEEIGQRAAELLFSRLERSHSSKYLARNNPEPSVLANRLVLRDSCGCAAYHSYVITNQST
jgi:LacI family transcriptional regulator, galactose operon repressor